MSQWYPHYPGDYMRDTLFLSLEEDGAYRRLIDHYYTTECALPADTRKLAIILRSSTRKTAKLMNVLSRYFELDGDKLYHRKIEFELSKSLKRRETAQANGRAGGKATAIAKAKANAQAKPQLPQPQPQSLSKDKDIKSVSNIENLNQKAWENYVQYRRSAKIKKLTPAGEKIAAKKLVTMAGGDHDIQQQIVEQSIGNGWTGLFELKGANNGTNRQSSSKVFDDGCAAAFESSDSEKPPH